MSSGKIHHTITLIDADWFTRLFADESRQATDVLYVPRILRQIGNFQEPVITTQTSQIFHWKEIQNVVCHSATSHTAVRSYSTRRTWGCERIRNPRDSDPDTRYRSPKP